MYGPRKIINFSYKQFQSSFVTKRKPMKIEKQTIDIFVADEGKILEVLYNGEAEPVYYDKICAFFIGECDTINEVDKSD